MSATLSKGIKLGYKATPETGTYTELTNLQEIPDLGNNAPEKIDITVLTDTAKKSMDGLADSAQDLAFKFLYDGTQFTTLSALTGSISWQITLPDAQTAIFTGSPSLKLDGVGVSAAMSYTLNISVDSLIIFS